MVAEEQTGLGALLHDDEHAAVDHQVYIRAENIDHLHGAVYLHVFRHIDQESVLRQHGVERRNAIVGRSGDLGIILGDKLRPLSRSLSEGTDEHPLGQLHLGQGLLIELVVDDEIERSGEIGHIAAEGLIRVDGYAQTVEVEPVVGREELLHVGILIALHFSRGESQALEILEGLVAHGIHYVHGVVANHLPVLTI